MALRLAALLVAAALLSAAAATTTTMTTTAPVAEDRALHVALHARWRTTRAPAAVETLSFLTRAFSPPAVLPPYLTRLCALRDGHHDDDDDDHARDNNRSTIDAQRDLNDALRALHAPLRDHPAARAALTWVLTARAHAPRAEARNADVHAMLTRFGVHMSDVSPVFFVLAAPDLSAATLVPTVRLIQSCTSAGCHAAQCPFCVSLNGLSSLRALRALRAGDDQMVLLEGDGDGDAADVLLFFADVAEPSFCDVLPHVLRAARETSRRVVLRVWHASQYTTAASLQPFAVRVALKSTEYRVVDDRVFATKLFVDCPSHARDICHRRPVASKQQKQQQQQQQLAAKPDLSFDAWRVLYFLSDAASRRLPAVLRRLRLFAEDTPSVVRAPHFRDVAVPNATARAQLTRKVSKLRAALPSNDHFLFINGRSLSPSSLLHAPHTFFRCLSSIATAAAYAPRLFAPEAERSALYAHLHRGRDVQPVASLRVDLRLDQRAPNALVRLNDMSADSRYKKWTRLHVASDSDVHTFVKTVEKRAAKAGATPNRLQHNDLVKVNADHLSLILVVDPGDAQQFNYLSVPQSVIHADIPIHVSVLLVPNGRTSSLVAAAFHYLLALKGRRTAVNFLTMIMEILEYLGAFQHVPLSPELVEMAFSRTVANLQSEYSSAADVLDRDESVKSILEESLRFARTMNLLSDVDDAESDDQEPWGAQADSAPKRKLSMLCVLNGIVVKDVGADVLPLALKEQQRIAKLLAHDHLRRDILKADRSFDRWVSVDPSLIVVQRIGRGQGTKEQRTLVTTSDDVLPPMTAGSLFSLRDSLAAIQYIPTPFKADQHTMTVWLAAVDHTLPEFIRAKGILHELVASNVVTKLRARVAVLDRNSLVNYEVLGCSTAFSCLDFPVLVINGKRVASSLYPQVDDVVVQLASHFDDADRSDLVDDDMRLLHRLQINEVSAACEESAGRAEDGVPFSVVKAAVKDHSHEAFSFVQNPQDDEQHSTPLSVLAVVDPLSPQAYIVASFLEELRSTFDSESLSMDIVLAPKSAALKKKQKAPDTFQKFVLQGRPVFQEETGNRLPPQASFFSLPQKSVLTVAVEPPRAWFVSSHATNYDMDNVILDTLPENVGELYAEYELTNLIVEGSCVDETGSPPQGLKLYLENDNGVSVDTLVMANLGYFQLKVPTPGRWNLRLAPGRSSKIYSLVRMEMYKDFTKTTYTADADGRVTIPVESFDGAGGILLRVKRNPGMEGMSLLNSDGEATQDRSKPEAGVLGRLMSSVTSAYSRVVKPGLKAAPASAGGDGKYDTIHVFSVASGHLYERFLKIMITSVTKHASRPVKFWLLENYLSPSFKKVLPLFAKRHGAQVGMVTYRWPGWLRAQTEKQRIIWAYKILFLDVLFPLDVGRIIFVDSDQVIRGDLAELMDIDMKGAPYGYVPFCDSRKEVEGYRFWKTGFWKDTLRGAKYHISALYVVDLNRFRETAAGDSLRSIYQALSADPNSLSNLDQDLPNYASTVSSVGGVVPIFDLPEEWLWCESWCDDESKERAKAIDLCNNPMTKEPKLSSAKRIIGEWVEYDNAASDLTEELYRYLQSQSTPNSTSENKACQASPSNSLHGKPSLPIADIQLKEEL
ncbi:unnamed protein product [Agarophyton chilense]|eukprot:gb/GEZJ01003109.1/.p1 GENE.gb/GEZJ01003109.1/~~gb/GEZJ01003109.1/.p1  ORF type:complete len:1622 (+),score=296.99 gb/GEZJ01003109.1/:135-5000(+)